MTSSWNRKQVCNEYKNGSACEYLCSFIETVSPEGTFCDTVQVPSGDGDMQLI